MAEKKCWLCRKPFKDGERVVPVGAYVESRQGDFVSAASDHIHASHLKQLWTTTTKERKAQ